MPPAISVLPPKKAPPAPVGAVISPRPAALIATPSAISTTVSAIDTNMLLFPVHGPLILCENYLLKERAMILIEPTNNNAAPHIDTPFHRITIKPIKIDRSANRLNIASAPQISKTREGLNNPDTAQQSHPSTSA